MHFPIGLGLKQNYYNIDLNYNFVRCLIRLALKIVGRRLNQ